MLLTLYTVHFRKVHAVSSSGVIVIKTDRQTGRQKDRKSEGQVGRY
jgi:hypothetical protein